MGKRSFGNQIKLYVNTLFHLTPKQIIWRARSLILQRIWSLTPSIKWYQGKIPSGLGPSLPHFGHICRTHDVDIAIKRAEALLNGYYFFINVAVKFENHLPDWKVIPDGDRLWSFYLHYFDYLRDILIAYKITGDQRYLDYIIKLILDWIDKNPFWTPIAWNPYPLSRRLVNWLNLLSHLCKEDVFACRCLEKVVVSICQQVRYLVDNIEYDIDNNHLISNAKALIWAGLYFAAFPEAKHWQQKGMSLLIKQLERQILPDGGHFERSCSYHILILQDLIEIAILLEQNGQTVPEALVRIISRMMEYLVGILKPDGNVPMLNDTVIGYPCEAKDILAVGMVYLKRCLIDCPVPVKDKVSGYLEWLLGEAGRKSYESLEKVTPTISSVSFPQSGYHVLRSQYKNDIYYCVFDVGDLGPENALSHAHADTLSLEIAVNARTRLIDPGVYEYKCGEWRDYFRSTASHNTIVVDGKNQSEVWNSFRVAHRAHAQVIDWEKSGNEEVIAGQHGGYLRIRDPVLHQRAICNKMDGQWEITDILRCQGRTQHYYELFFHLTPCEITYHYGPGQYQAIFDDGVILTFVTEHPIGTTARILNGWISYSWKQKLEAPVISYSLTTKEAVTRFKTTLRFSRRDRSE